MQADQEQAGEAPRRPARRGRRPWPLGLVGMALLIGLVEWALAQQPDLAHPWAVDWGQAVRSVPRQASRARVFCFGDSLMKYGVSAPILADRLHRPCYNFALGASPPPVHLAMLRQTLAAGARPDAILLEFAPHILAEGNSLVTQLMPEVLGPREIIQLGWDSRDPPLAARLLAAWVFPSVHKRLEAREAITAALAGDARTDRTIYLAAGRRNWRVNCGSYVSGRANRPPGDDFPYDRAFYPPKWSVDPVSARMVRRMLRLATATGVPVFWVIPPFSPEVHARRQIEGQDRLYDQFVNQMLAHFPTVTVIDGRTAGYPAAAHCDPLHLDRRGAAIFTEEVAAVVAARLAQPAGPGPRVTLPPYRDRPADSTLEDNIQSQIVVTQDPAIRARR